MEVRPLVVVVVVAYFVHFLHLPFSVVVIIDWGGGACKNKRELLLFVHTNYQQQQG